MAGNFSLLTGASLRVPPHALMLNSSATTLTVWDFRAIFRVGCDVSALLLNGFLLYLFHRDRVNRTPFQVYVANLCYVNLFYVASFAVTMANTWVAFPRVPPWLYCAFIRYLLYVTSGLVNNAHLLIAINRAWAITFPISYRRLNRNITTNIHNPSVICLTMWLYVHICIIPGIAMDTMKTRSPVEMYHCSPSVLWPFEWLVATQYLVYNLPIAASFLLYLLIIYLTINRSVRKHCIRIAHLNELAVSFVPPQKSSSRLKQLANRAIRKVGPSQSRINVYSNQQQSVKYSKEQQSVKYSKEQQSVKFSQLTLSRRIKIIQQSFRRNQFLALSLLTLNVAVCLMPAQIFFSLLIAGRNPPGMYGVVSILYALSPTIDPILLLFSVKSFRKSLCNIRSLC